MITSDIPTVLVPRKAFGTMLEISTSLMNEHRLLCEKCRSDDQEKVSSCYVNQKAEGAIEEIITFITQMEMEIAKHGDQRK